MEDFLYTSYKNQLELSLQLIFEMKYKGENGWMDYQSFKSLNDINEVKLHPTISAKNTTLLTDTTCSTLQSISQVLRALP